jgi:hypothetical protein
LATKNILIGIEGKYIKQAHQKDKIAENKLKVYQNTTWHLLEEYSSKNSPPHKRKPPPITRQDKVKDQCFK